MPYCFVENLVKNNVIIKDNQKQCFLIYYNIMCLIHLCYVVSFVFVIKIEYYLLFFRYQFQ